MSSVDDGYTGAGRGEGETGEEERAGANTPPSRSPTPVCPMAGRAPAGSVELPRRVDSDVTAKGGVVGHGLAEHQREEVVVDVVVRPDVAPIHRPVRRGRRFMDHAHVRLTGDSVRLTDAVDGKGVKPLT